MQKQAGESNEEYLVDIMKKRNSMILVLLCVLTIAVLAAPVSAGLMITDGDYINSPYGAASHVITITDPPIQEGGTITIDVSMLAYYFVKYGYFTNDNVIVTSNSLGATWNGTVSDDGSTLTLMSSGGPTVDGDTITVIFTGAVNPWIPDSSVITPDPISYTITATRTDTGDTADLYFNIFIVPPPPGGLSVSDGDWITSPSGATSSVITIEDTPIPQNGTIVIEVPAFYLLVNNSVFNNTNVEVTSDADTAVWTRNVTSIQGIGDVIILKSTGGPTDFGKSVNITFTGAVNPWKPDTGEQNLLLTPTRTDTAQTADLYFKINTTSLVTLGADFTASPTSGIALLSVTFTDKSVGNPTNWTWDFGDGGNSTDQNPVHTYTNEGQYTVTLTVTDGAGFSLVSKMDYIDVLSGLAGEADTEFPGLTVTNCGGPQTIFVNTSILTNYILSPDKLEIQAPPESGFDNITFYGAGFSQVGDLITGDPTGVHLVSVDLAPSSGFSDSVGKISSFTYAIDLPSYPCNAKLSSRIWEGAPGNYDIKLRQVADKNNAGVAGTAYTVEISKSNFPPGATAKIYMSVNSSWKSSLRDPTGKLFIWRIADDGNSGQILPTTYLGSDLVNNIAFYEADSPLGLSTFGVSSLTGNNNPFQIIALIGSNIISQGISGQSGQGSGSGTSVSANDEPGSPYSEIQGGGIVVPTPVATSKPAPLSQPAMSTNVGMAGWLLAIIQDYPIILVGVAGVIAVAAYFGWWKRRL